MSFPFRSCFTWWLVKIVGLPPKESFKASSIMIAKISKAGEPASGKLDRAFWISKLQAGAQIPTFELTLPMLFPLFHGHKVGMLFLGLATSRQLPELRFVLV